jgi:hypothetical protein
MKELLLKDLCSRISFGVKCNVGDDKPYTLSRIEVDEKNGHLLDFIEKKDGLNMQVYLSEVKPYLYPLSSMTEEQKRELEDMGWSFNDSAVINNIIEYLGKHRQFVTHFDCFALIDWLNVNHFDYRGLIPMGLSLDCTNLDIY